MSRQELNRRRRAGGFIGRTSELNVFRDNLARDPQDAAFQYLFHVHGNAGVGKTSLVRQWEAAAQARQAVTAYVDDTVHSVIEAMEAVSAQLEQQGVPMKAFQDQLAAYRQRRHEVETSPGFLGLDTATDPGGPPSASASTSSTVIAQAGLAGLGLLPGVGAIAGAMDPQALAQGTDRLRAVIGARFRGHDDLRLVFSPLRVLTPAFLADLEKAAERRPWIALFFDVFERTGPLLNEWLRDVLAGDVYGSLPDNVVATLSGQGRLDARCWGDHQYLVCEVALEEFTEAEARNLLAAHGITNEQVIEVVLELSGRLPVLVDLLAQTRPSDPEAIGDPSGTAVDRFLRWIPDGERRAAALACALPLQLNEDVYRAAVPAAAADQYPWLRELPFVTGQGGSCRYHDIVRAPMLRLQRTQSPEQWRHQHTRLAEAFQRRREARESALAPDAYGADPDWQDHRVNETYHRLCADPVQALPDALHNVVHACDTGTAPLRRWAQALAQAGHDTDTAALVSWGTRLQDAADDDTALLTALTHLIAATELPTPARALAHTLRGREHRLAERYDQAVADCTTALSLSPDLARAHYGLGAAHALAGRNDEALVCLDRAVALDPADSEYVGSRAEVHRLTGRHEEALAGFTRAITLDPTEAEYIVSRAKSYHSLSRYDEALADFHRAVALDPDYAWALASRAQTHRALGQYDQAMADLDRAIELEPDEGWVIAGRGEIHRLTGRLDQALADFDRAIALEPDYPWGLASRALTHRALGQYDQAMADLDRAIELNPRYYWAIGNRAQIHRATEKYDLALADYDRALELAPETDWLLAGRGETHRLMNHFEEALADLTRAIELDPGYASALGNRAQVHRATEKYDLALADYDRALELAPETDWLLAGRGETHRLAGRPDEAVGNFDRALALNPDYAWALGSRGQSHRAAARYEQALTDLGRAIELAPDADWILAERGETHRLMNRYDEALADFDRALALSPEYLWALVSRAQTYRAMERFDRALTDYDRAVALAPESGWVVAGRGETSRRMDRCDEALADFDRAIALSPDYMWAIGSRAETYVAMERYDLALADYDRALELAPESSWIAADRGETYRLMRRYEQALTDFDRALALDPEYAWALTGRAETYHALRRYDEALTDLDRARALDPAHGWLHLGTAVILHALGRPDEQEHWRAAAEMFAEDASGAGITGMNAMGNLVVVRCATGAWGEAATELEEFLSRGPTVWRVREALRDLADVEREMDVDPARLEPLRRRLREAEAAPVPGAEG